MGPLTGVRVVEVGGLGPVPFAGMVLSDLGAQVLRIVRLPDSDVSQPAEDVVVGRGRATVRMDLKRPASVDAVLAAVDGADVLIEGFRPGVMEGLGLGPVPCRSRNPALVYGRMTGWGQDGPLAKRAGHDLNYIGYAGVLNAIGRSDDAPPAIPLNLVADYGGGAMLLALGVVCALYERTGSGLGQVVDAAMIDGVSLLSAGLHGLRHQGAWVDRRGTNLIDSGAPFYEVYRTCDQREVAVAALEPKFFATLIRTLGLDESWLPAQQDRSRWPELRSELARVFRTRTQAQWATLFADVDACVTPVLTFAEAARDIHLASRETLVEHEGAVQPAPAPRFSRTPGAIRSSRGDLEPEELLLQWGVPVALLARIRHQGGFG